MVIKSVEEVVVLCSVEHVDQTVPDKHHYDDDHNNDNEDDYLDAEARYEAALGPFLPLSPANEYSKQST